MIRFRHSIRGAGALSITFIVALFAATLLSAEEGATNKTKTKEKTTEATKAEGKTSDTKSPEAAKAKGADKEKTADSKKKDAPAEAKQTEADADTTMKLEGGEDGTIFKSLRIEGEDRIRIEFERPSLDLNLDPRTAPGLDWDGIQTAIQRNSADLVGPYMSRSAKERPPLTARPWLDYFTTDGVARFRPDLEGVESWRLVIADSRGRTVKTFDGKGKPPKEIVWDGRDDGGTPVTPGLVYSYVLEAYDKAGNKRNFVGDGFELPPYRIMEGDATTMLMSGKTMTGSTHGGSSSSEPVPAMLLEAASWINQSPSDHPVRVEVTARTFDEAKSTADMIVQQLSTIVLGNPSRFHVVTNVETDAPEYGSVNIAVSRDS